MSKSAFWAALAMGLAGCAISPEAPKPAPRSVRIAALPEERHLAELRQLTFGGENAEAYWSFDGTQLSFQARAPEHGCDRIYRMKLAEDPPKPTQLSSGKGATTCAHFLPGDQAVVFASTHLGGESCPPRPDRSMGYVWALYDSYDLFRVGADGSGLTRLTDTPGYDAEATVCPKDGSIIFTSVRDGDLELYRMDADGKNVKRLTFTPGYDGGAFFNRDCSQIVWRASRPKPGKELEDYQRLLAQGLVRPSKLELFVANADGSDPVQLTYLNAASFAPYWHPSSRRILFSTNYGDPKGREFDLWAVDVDGSNLERITYAPGFDGFPMFSPDGEWLAFSSNRATAPGTHDTNVFVARWMEGTPAPAESGVDRIRRDVAWLADRAREGRGVGTAGLQAAGEYIEQRFAQLGLSPAGEGGGFRQPFPVTVGVEVKDGTGVRIGGTALASSDFRVLGFSSEGQVSGPLVLAGYGISDRELGIDDYAGRNVRGKVVLVRRFVPDVPALSDTAKQRRFGDLRYKAWVARERGAKALLVVDLPEPPAGASEKWAPPAEAALPALHPDGAGDAGLPVLVLKRAAVQPHLATLRKGKPLRAEVQVALRHERRDAFNVVGKLAAGAPPEKRLPGAIVIGAHYDHLGMGGRYSLAPDKMEPHLGADDNASGVAGLLEIARILSERRSELRRDVVFVAFSGEESGVLGSTHFTRTPSAGISLSEVVGMLNLDMVGRLRANKLQVLGADSASEWSELIDAACARARVDCTAGGDGYGPSDQTPFYAAGMPVLHFFTGAHADYHKPSDAPERVNAIGIERVASIAAEVAQSLSGRAERLTYRKTAGPAPRGDLRTFNASLGTIPDYAGPPNGQKGVLLAGVREGGAAAHAGMRRGDVLIRLGQHPIGSVEDLMYVLNASRPGETVTAVVVREGQQVVLEATFQESKRR